jgi:hypothetical protein
MIANTCEMSMASARSFSGVGTNIAQFAHLLAQFVLQGVVHETWSIALRTFEKGSLLFKGNSITIKHANFFCYRA